MNTFVSRISDISPSTREKKLNNRSIHDFVFVVYVFHRVVTSEKVKTNVMKQLKWLVNERMILNKHYFSKNLLLQSSYIFLKKFIDSCDSNVVY